MSHTFTIIGTHAPDSNFGNCFPLQTENLHENKGNASENGTKNLFFASLVQARTLFLIGILVASGGCQYDPEFDALTNFPSNPQSKPIAELDLVAPDIEKEELVQTNLATAAQSIAKKPDFITIEKGVRAYDFNAASRSDVSKFVLLDQSVTSLKASPPLNFTEQNLDKIDSPFSATGLAAADFNNDRLADILVVDQKQGVRLYQNLGDCRFEEITQRLEPAIGSMWGTSATIVDINNDGLLDFYLCGYDAPNRLYVNRGRKFVEQAGQYGIDFKGASLSAAFADYDRDGDLDLYLVTNRLSPDTPLKQLPVDREPGKPPRIKEKYRELNHFIPYHNGGFVPVLSGQYDYLFQNNDSRFEDVTLTCLQQKQPYRGMSAVWTDFDQDGWPDLYVTNGDKNPDQFLRNNGPDATGQITFLDHSQRFKQTSWFAAGIDVFDLNHDGYFDLLIGGQSKSSPIERAYSRGNLFGQKNDKWFLNWSTPSQTLGNCVAINYQGQHFGNVANSLKLAHTDKTWSIRALDFDNDGQTDLYCGNGNIRDFLDNDLKREFESSVSKEKIAAKGQFWKDKPPVKKRNLVFRGQSDMTFEDAGEFFPERSNDLTQAVVVHDFDHDGDIDILTAGNGEPVRLYRNDVVGGKSIVIKLIGQGSNRYGIGSVCKLVEEPGGTVQLATSNSNRGFLSSEEPTFHFGVGDRDEVESLEIKWPSGVVQSLEKLRTNLYYEIEEPEGGRLVGRGIQMDLEKKLFISEKRIAQEIEIEELEYDNFAQQPLAPFGHSTLGPGMAWGDIDGDQDYDLFIAGSSFEPGRLFENRNGKLRILEQEVFQADAKREDLGCLFFDADSDGDEDLYVVSGGVEDSGPDAYRDRLYLNNGNGGFTATENALPNSSFSGMSISAADFDKDGDIDLFVGGRILPGQYPRAASSRLLVNLGGRFEDGTKTIAPGLIQCGMVTASSWADVDQDGRLDLLICSDWGPVRIFRNTNAGLKELASTGLENNLGLFRSIHCGDVDNDGDLDFVVGNQGTNSSWMADGQHPVSLHYGDFGIEPNSKRIVASYLTADRQLPLRSMDALSEWVSFDSKFESSTLFAKAEVRSIFGKQWQQAISVSVNEFRSGVLINNSIGENVSFEFRPLPLVAQTSPIRGCHLCDINGDGFLDLCALQNEDAVHPLDEQANSGKGLLLFGDGTGAFELPTKDSGWFVPGIGKSLTAVDLNRDARVDFVATEKNSKINFFINQSGHTPFAIDVKQISGKKQIIGTTVSIDFEDGSRQLHQIQCGTGYISQSPPIIYSGLNMNSDIRQITIVWPDGTRRSGTVKSLFNK